MRSRKLLTSSLLTFAAVAPFVLPTKSAKADPTPLPTIICEGDPTPGPENGSGSVYTPPTQASDCSTPCPLGLSVDMGSCVHLDTFADGSPNPNSAWWSCTCNAPLPAPSPVHTEVSEVTDVVVALLYSPPGKSSTTEYNNGASVGSKTEIKNTGTAGYALHLEAAGVQVDTTVSAGIVDGNTFETKASTSWGDVLTNNLDFGAHTNDTFYIWTNAELQLQISDALQYPVSSKLGIRSLPQNKQSIEKVTLGQLVGYDPITATQAASFEHLTAVDRYNILRLDPWFGFFLGENYQARLDPARFINLMQHFQIDNTSNVSVTNGHKTSLDNETTKGAISGNVANANVTIEMGVSFSFWVTAKAQQGMTFSLNYERNEEDYSGGTANAATTIQSTTPCFHQGIDIWFDTMFGTYLYLPTDAGSVDCTDTHFNVQGYTTDSLGNIVPHRGVRALLQNGQVWYGSSNENGLYRFQNVYSPVRAIAAENAKTLVTVPGPIEVSAPKPGAGIPIWVNNNGPVMYSEIPQIAPTGPRSIESLAHRVIGPMRVDDGRLIQ